MFVILLTNRVHAARARRPAKVIADVRADLSDAAALAVTDDPGQTIAMPASFRADRGKGLEPSRAPRQGAPKCAPWSRDRAHEGIGEQIEGVSEQQTLREQDARSAPRSRPRTGRKKRRSCRACPARRAG